jgi:hypothetical protein
MNVADDRDGSDGATISLPWLKLLRCASLLFAAAPALERARVKCEPGQQTRAQLTDLPLAN